ncbi:molybdate ABC transporter permease subunit [Vibrio natriegens]|uniref:Molybdenum transport system permease n=2 Tax=Vibrionaceae TaxID=641 RepID=A0AAN0Y6X9_VIBNA|nr:molybdate ABC transporter permease subunit [Vibrio natriegens]ALR18312.1 molybdate ABC transporter permease [Vibrio natriegens NBRC 15636 = ATCC 14048 = DSM 759]ANQ14260.1 molybdate ABC transporter permease [Vibrio natriegens NBRC 15636 = ATCC 14048 = DSM 759]EPM40296.1 molybdenum ABC transporter permease [Vibrio natriegens NBRC 15636 = ATCC 14048 = DSM 759]MDX6028801.1 molybdate ABC transporter permease subunit [Vibrio natriegens NBRC 15636 = ATCC 14048 = DSM 759]UUI14483.1 molybdate ABC t
MTELEYQALILSLKVGAFAVLWLIPLGVLLAWLLSRKTFFGKSVLDSLIHLPLVLPPVVIGYLLLLSLGRQGFIGSWLYEHFGLVFSFDWKGAVVACIVVALPLMVRSVRLSLESVDPKLEHAASTLGASPFKVFMTITLPLTIPGIITGTMLSFARSLGEFGATISFVSNIPGETQTIPLAMYNFIETPGAEMQAARLCIISIALALSTLMASEWMNRKAARRLGAK